MKTAISIQPNLFNQVNDLAGRLNISRSYLFVLAVKDFIKRYQNKKLLQEINTAYEDFPDPQEKFYQQKIKAHHRKLLRKDKW